MNVNDTFPIQPLDVDANEANDIEELLLENDCYAYGRHSERIKEDTEQLKLITSEIKSIGQQGIALMGERVHRARELLKAYKDGTFTKWLESTFGTRKTGYNLLSYHKLYTSLPPESRERLISLPPSTAYILASRRGDIEVKADIINEHHDKHKKHGELVTIIQEKLPIPSKDKRRVQGNKKLLAEISKSIQKLQVCRDTFTDDDKMSVEKMSAMMTELISV